MTMAKGIANGMPVANTIATEEVANSFTGLTISTFGGNPLACSAGRAVIRTIEDDGLLENVRVRRAGFAVRMSFEHFMRRFKMCAPATWPRYAGADGELDRAGKIRRSLSGLVAGAGTNF